MKASKTALLCLALLIIGSILLQAMAETEYTPWVFGTATVMFPSDYTRVQYGETNHGVSAFFKSSNTDQVVWVDWTDFSSNGLDNPIYRSELLSSGYRTISDGYLETYMSTSDGTEIISDYDTMFGEIPGRIIFMKYPVEGFPGIYAWSCMTFYYAGDGVLFTVHSVGEPKMSAEWLQMVLGSYQYVTVRQ